LWGGGFDETFGASVLMEEISLKPIITGDDLMFLGLKPGPRFKDILGFCLEAQDRGELVQENKQAFLRRLVAKDSKLG
jgi:hypothetical protein